MCSGSKILGPSSDASLPEIKKTYQYWEGLNFTAPNLHPVPQSHQKSDWATAQIPGNQFRVWVDLPSFTPIVAKFDVISLDVNRKIMTGRKLLAMPGCPRWELVAVAPPRQVVRNSYWTVGRRFKWRNFPWTLKFSIIHNNNNNNNNDDNNDNNKNHYCFWSFHRISYDNFHELYETMASHKRGFHEGRFHNPETTALSWFLGVASVWILKNSTRLHWNLKLTILDLSVHGPKKLRNVSKSG